MGAGVEEAGGLDVFDSVDDDMTAASGADTGPESAADGPVASSKEKLEKDPIESSSSTMTKIACPIYCKNH